MRIAAAGAFGEEVGEAVAAALAGRATGPARSTVAILDSFDLAEVRRLAAYDPAEPLLLCFLTLRGLFVSSWLTPRGPCLLCFSRRWDANLPFWEHSFEQEEMLRHLARHSPALRSFPVPSTAAAMAAAAIVERVEEPPDRGCWYIDLVSADTASGRLLRVDGCPSCGPRGDPVCRYTAGLAALAARWAS